jgi:lipopolysaccharide/colanic/teichoic acid biosynthesis glycosyltransferase
MATLSFEPASFEISAAHSSDRRPKNSVPFSVRAVKRSVDVAFALSSLFVAAWVFPLIGLAIRLESRGPVLYRQRRVAELLSRDAHGRCRFREFDMLKFRTMRMGAEASTGAVLAEEEDPRVTRVGRFLRKSRLDELPQLFNVLSGDMSLVGPRPERPELLENLMLAIPFFEERMRDSKPGITGYAQVSLGYSGHVPDGSPVAPFQGRLVNPLHLEGADGALADDMRMKLLYDLAYVSALESFWSFIGLELAIIARTPWVMFKGVGR